MQDSNSQLSAAGRSSGKWLKAAAIAVPVMVMLCAAMAVMPTFDDWTTLVSPNRDPDFLKYFLPFGPTWRPFDAIMGYVNGIDSRLYPALNHLLVVTAHTLSAWLVWLVLREGGVKRTARGVATAFFFLSPCMLATVLSVDALGQSYSHLFGMAAVYAYLRTSGRRRVALWLTLTALATFSKDNGLAWVIVPPIIAFAFRRETARDMWRHIAVGLAFAAIYAAVRLSFPAVDNGNHEHAEEMVSLASKVSGTAKWLGYTFTATDFLALFHKPSRNIILVLLTFALSLPFLACLLWPKKSSAKTEEQNPAHAAPRVAVLCAAMVVVASPNLLIAMSLMNTYCSLGVAAIIIGCLADRAIRARGSQSLRAAFALYLVAAIVTDVHHWYMAWQTSLTGLRLAREVVSLTGKPVEKAYSVSLKDDYPKYSSFCVPADEAYGWGRSVMQVTDYQWPKQLNDTTIDETEASDTLIMTLAKKKLSQGYDCVWIVGKDKVEIVR